MKIKILSRTKGTIISAVLPAEGDIENLAEGGPAERRGTKFDDIELPATTASDDIPKLLRHSRVKRGKKSASLKVSKKWKEKK